MRKLILLSSCLFCFSFYGFNQPKQTKLKVSFSLNQSLSHSGINLGLMSNWRLKNWEIYLGPEMALTDSYFRDNPRMGFTTGLRFYTTVSEKSSSFLFANYQRILYRPFLDANYPSKELNTSTEFTLGLGQEWKVYKNWHLGGSMGYGKYFDVFHDLANQNTVYFDDGTALLRFSITYKLK